MIHDKPLDKYKKTFEDEVGMAVPKSTQIRLIL